MTETQENQTTGQPASGGCCCSSKKEAKPEVKPELKKEAKPSCCVGEKHEHPTTEK